jgi:hypothetical protein
MKDSSFWSVLAARVMSSYAIAIFAVMWVGFVIALIVNPEWLDAIWSWVRGLPLLAEIVVWVALLPIMVGLWIWTSSWPVLLGLLGFAGLIGWTAVAVSSFVRAVR